MEEVADDGDVRKLTIISCKWCGEDMERLAANHKYHPECFTASRIEPPTVVGVKRVNCKTCGTEFVKATANQKFCDECGFSAKNRLIKKSKIRTIVCADCGISCERDLRAIRCEECSATATKAKQKEWRANNSEKLKDDKRRYADENPEKVYERTKRWRSENPERRKEQTAKRRREDPKYRLRYAISNGIRISLKSGKQGRSWESLVGYTLDELHAHLEKQFLPGMSWENYGNDGWHVDHILADSFFDYSSPEDADFKRAWAMTNLRPLWANDNLKKNAKRLFLI